jgi:hypothetical protein
VLTCYPETELYSPIFRKRNTNNNSPILRRCGNYCAYVRCFKSDLQLLPNIPESELEEHLPNTPVTDLQQRFLPDTPETVIAKRDTRRGQIAKRDTRRGHRSCVCSIWTGRGTTYVGGAATYAHTFGVARLTNNYKCKT